MKLQHVFLVALLCLAMGNRMVSGALLSVDINDRGFTGTPPLPQSNTQSGFSSYVLSGTTASVSVASSQAVGAFNVTLTPIDDGLDENVTTAGVQNTLGAIDDRPRATPVNGGALTYADIYYDFVFAGSSVGPTGGIDLNVSGGALLANTQYVVSIYAFDSGSTVIQPRTANWLDGNNSDALVLSTSFTAAVLPTTNDQYKFTGIAQTDGLGMLFLKGRNTTALPATGGIQPGVFINAFEIDAVPEPTSIGLVMIATSLLGLARRRRCEQH